MDGIILRSPTSSPGYREQQDRNGKVGRMGRVSLIPKDSYGEEAMKSRTGPMSSKTVAWKAGPILILTLLILCVKESTNTPHSTYRGSEDNL